MTEYIKSENKVGKRRIEAEVNKHARGAASRISTRFKSGISIPTYVIPHGGVLCRGR